MQYYFLKDFYYDLKAASEDQLLYNVLHWDDFIMSMNIFFMITGILLLFSLKSIFRALNEAVVFTLTKKFGDILVKDLGPF